MLAARAFSAPTRRRKYPSCSSSPTPSVALVNTQALPPDPAAEAGVRQWLTQDWPAAPHGVRCDDEHITGEPLRFRVESVEVVEMFSSGTDVAFHARQHGRYLGGLAGVAASDRAEALLVNGILRVAGGQVQGGRVIRDRGGLRSRLGRG